MADDPLGVLFDRYRREGDPAALARVVEAVAPELLRIARYLRPRGQTPEDLVQTTFLAALASKERYDSRRPLRPWLFGILLNKAAGGRRQELELAIEVPDGDGPDDYVEAAEAARLLARGLERLPPIYSEVLRDHFFAGLSPQDIAARHGRPPGTVRAQLHRGLRLLRVLVPTGLAGRLLWLGLSRASLLRIRRAVLEQAAIESGSASVRPGAPSLVSVRIAGVFAVGVAVVLGLRELSRAPKHPVAPEQPRIERVSELPIVLPESSSPDTGTRDDADATPSTEQDATVTHGELIVRVLFPDGTPAPGVGVRVHAGGEPSWRTNRTDGVTDEAGEFALERIHAGRVGIYCDRGGDNGFGTTVIAGEPTVREISLPQGVDVVGEVVDARGMPVPRAGIWLSESPLSDAGRITLTCDEFGQFLLRHVSPHRFLGARASGLAPSELEWLASGGLREGSTTRIRLLLPDSGGSIAGTVLDALGAPVQGANVQVRSRSAGKVRLRQDGTLLGPSTPFETTTNVHGRFEFADLALEEYELVVRAAGHPEHFESVQLSPSKPFDDLELRLTAGGKLSGTVSFPDGEPAVGAVVIASSGALGFMDHEVDERGAFALEGLAPGEIEVQAGYGHTGGGRLARETLWLHAAGELNWNAIVDRPMDYAGRVLGPSGEPLAGAWLHAVATERENASETLPEDRDALAVWLVDWQDRSLKWQLNQVATDSDGRFTLRGVPRPFAVEVRFPDGRTGWPSRVFDPPPANGELALSANDRHTARLSGTLVDSNDRPLASGEVFAVRRAGGSRKVHLDANGAFRFEFLPPGTFDVLLWTRGHLPQVVVELTLAEGEERELGRLRLSR